jgi:hypothetical protein
MMGASSPASCSLLDVGFHFAGWVSATSIQKATLRLRAELEAYDVA